MDVVMGVVMGVVKGVVKRSRAGGLALALLVACSGKDSGRHEQHSVLLVTLDTTRADALSCYGARSGTTPELDALAREGVLYERAYTCAPITLAAHASILTGLVPLRHGLRDNGMAALDPAAHTLAEAAHAAGVQTAAFVGAVVLDRALGLDQGFDVYDGPPAQRSQSGHPTERSAKNVIDSALAWLDGRDRARPFFLWVHLYDAHYPYAPKRALPEKSTELERYLAEVSEMDAELGRLFAHLGAENVLGDTLVCVTADHGEAFGEHQEVTHGAFCWNTTLHVPLLIRFPDGRRAGEHERELVGVVDLAPTLAEELGTTLGPDIDGRSLLAPRAGEGGGVYFESYAGYFAFGWSPIAGWIDERGKYVHCSRPELYDLAQDPGEEHDLAAGAAPELLEHFRGAIAAVAAKPALVGKSGTIDGALRAQIQDLGYAAVDAEESAIPPPLAPDQRPSPHAMVGAWRESMLAQELMNRGRFEEAATKLHALLADDPGNGFLRGVLATALMRLKRHQEAFDVLLPLLEAPRVQPQTCYKLGVCALKLGRREEAARYLERAVELAPDEARYREKLAAVRSGKGAAEEDE
jgi:arylsulfatase A-like enzyme/Tfp pilus assembly protein PilF